MVETFVKVDVERLREVYITDVKQEEDGSIIIAGVPSHAPYNEEEYQILDNVVYLRTY